MGGPGGTAKDLRFRLVKAVGRLLHPLIRKLDLRAHPLPGQVTLLPKRTVRWDLSKLTWIGPEPFWSAQREYTLDAAYRVELRDAEMIGHGVVITKKGEAVLESTLFQQSYLRRSHVEHLIVGRRFLDTERFDAVVPLTNFLDLSYFHWTLEAVGRLALVEDQLKDPVWKVLISEREHRYLRNTIAFLFGLEDSRVVSSTAKRKVMARCLMVSNPHSRSVPGAGVEVYPPEHLRWLNTRGHERIGGVRPERRNIVISRRKQIGRKITNEEVLLQRFPQLDLEFVTLEDLDVREQVDTFAHAGVIIAVHGAGLANLVYATDAAVIELYPTPLQAKNSAYFVQIAACLGLSHLVLHYEGTGPAPHWDATLTTEQLDHMESFLRAQGKVG
jgi:hypothetical protein